MDNEEVKVCECTHYEYSHDVPGDACGYFINEHMGDCPCEKFKEQRV